MMKDLMFSTSNNKKNIRVLVTGVGAIIGQGLIKSLRMLDDVYIVGLDLNPKAFGRHCCDSFYCKPDAAEDSPIYQNFLLELFERESINLVLPGIEQDIHFFDRNRCFFSDVKTKLVLNNSKLINLSKDKWLMHQALTSAGLRSIPSHIEDSWELSLNALGEPPFLFKPRRGSGGRGQAIIETKKDLEYFWHKQKNNFMLQRIIGSADEEYTVGLFGYGNGRASSPAILRRTLGPGGATWSAQTIAKDKEIELVCDELTRLFKPIGPTNYQFRKEAGQVWLLEINPRFSASVSLRSALGFNEAKMAIDYYCYNVEDSATEWKSAYCERYIEDHIEYV